jgi:hypothetical protein
LESAREDDLEEVISMFEVLFNRHPVGNELIVGSGVR